MIVRKRILHRTVAHHKAPPDRAIHLAKMLNLIAKVGRYLNRKGDPQPGPTPVWVVLQKLRAFIQAKQIPSYLLWCKCHFSRYAILISLWITEVLL